MSVVRRSNGPACVAVDMEMTGRGSCNEIIEIAAVKFVGDTVLGRFSSLVRPSRSVPASVSSLTGIRQADVSRAPTLDHVAPRFLTFIGNLPVVGQSVHFDLDLLASHGFRVDNPRFDTFELATIFLPNLPAYDLASIASHLGIVVSGQHRAMHDAELAMRVFLAIKREIERLGYETVTELAGLVLSGSPLSAILSDVIRSMSTVRKFSGYNVADLLVAQGIDPVDLSLEVASGAANPLEPRYPPVKVDPAVLEGDFAPDGPLSRELPDYEPRPGQLAMMRLVLNTFNEGGVALVEAATGTGKSLAYLIPAARYAMANQARVVVSTKTINLQEQLLYKDIPLVQAVVGGELRAALLKGRSNYLCLDRWKEFRKRPVLAENEARLKARLLVWLKATDTGDRSELNILEDEEPVWQGLSSAAEGCRPALCQEWMSGRCFLRRAREKAEAAHVLVVNHSLLLSDPLAENRVIPPYRHLIVDEAHHLEAEATEQFGFRVPLDWLHKLLSGLANGTSRVGKTLVEVSSAARSPGTRERARTISREASSLLPMVSAVVKMAREILAAEAADQQGSRVRVQAHGQWGDAWQPMVEMLQTAIPSLRSLAANMVKLAEDLDSAAPPTAALLEDSAMELQGYTMALSEIFARPDSNKVYWLGPEDGDLCVCGAPVYVAPLLQQRLFERLDSVVLTSATLTVDGEFRFFASRLGIGRARELSVASPFDYASSVLVYVADDLPDPNSSGYQRALAEHVGRIVEAAAGRTLVLFTSNSALRATYKALEPRLARQDIVPLGHGIDGSRRNLIRRFTTLPRAVLFGSASFWEGVDVVGEALSVLVLTRLPFEVPGDPVFSARAEQFADPFTEFSIPSAILRFKQGFGRLIRSPKDRGVVVILDSRVARRKYGERFLRSLPQCEIEVGPAWGASEAVRRWLAR